MLEVAVATACDALAQKVSGALPRLESGLSRYVSLSHLLTARGDKRFDLIVLHHPHDGFHEGVYTRLDRYLPKATPAIAIVPEQHLACSVPLLNAGVDRCLPESFDDSHFSAVVRALTRRRHGLVSSVTQYGDLRFHHETKQASLQGQEIELTRREAQVLEVFLKRLGQIIPKETFIEEMDPHHFDLSPASVEVYIYRLRQKIPSDHLPIRNIKRCGYLLNRFQAR
jgi:DNA-binding response OmpR family regulator